jgi:hypothetical protein
MIVLCITPQSISTQDLRLAIQLILIPSEVPSIHYHTNPSVDKEKVDVLEVDTDFYMKFNPWMQPEGAKLIDSFHHEFKPLSIDEFEIKLRGKRFDQDLESGFFSRLKKLMTI